MMTGSSRKGEGRRFRVQHAVAGSAAIVVGLVSGQPVAAQAAAPSMPPAPATQVSALAGSPAGGRAQAEPASNQTAADQSTAGDIVVTAQRRSESLQRVPLAVTAVTGDVLAKGAINDLAAMTAVVPSLNLGQQLGAARITLRGIGLENVSAGAEGSIAFYVDDVFISRSIAALASFYDVQQVEVLRGPQGTLYGRNATGGAINITTRAPTEELSGYANLTIGKYNRVIAEGATSGALVPDKVLLRVAFQSQNRDGFGKNVVTGNDIDDLNSKAIRGTLLLKPTDRLTATIKADYYRQSDRSGSYHYLGGAGFAAPGLPTTPTGVALGGAIAPNIRDIASPQDPHNYVRFWGVQSALDYELSNAVQLKSITSFRKLSYTSRTNLDPSSLGLAPTEQFENDDQFSQEIQVSGSTTGLNWIVGGFYFHENDAGGISVPFNNVLVGFPSPGTLTQGYFAGGRIKTDAYAAYGQATYEVIDRLKLTLGARYSNERKSGVDHILFDYLTPYNPTTRQPVILPEKTKSFNSFTPRVALDFQATSNLLVYGSWSKGFKSGTYSLGAGRPAVNPEQVDAYEAGLKSQWLDRKLRLNVAGFYYNYTDLQVGKVVNSVLVLENAATAKIYGLEAELTADISPRLQVNANGSWLHARFSDFVSYDPSRPFGDGTGVVDPSSGLPAFNLKGNALSQSPDFTAFASVDYKVPTSVGDFVIRGEVSWRDRVFYSPFNVDAVSQKQNTKLNAFLNWTSNNNKVTSSAYIKNISNITTVSSSFISTGLVGFPINGYLDEPRTYGLRVGYSF